MQSMFFWCFTLALGASVLGCSSAKKTAAPESSSKVQSSDGAPARPWQKIMLKGGVQTSIEAFGARMFVRAWPSAENKNPTSALLTAITEIKRIETLTSPNSPNGEIFAINEKSWDGPVSISDELAQILIECDKMYRASEGKFDVAYVPYRGERDFVEEDINKIRDWDREPALSPKPMQILGKKVLLLDLANGGQPAKVRRYNRRHRVNLNGMIRGYAIERVARLLSQEKMGGFEIISEGLIGAAGVALQDPGILCLENPTALGTCFKKLQPLTPSRIYFFGTSASLERRGKMFDPTSSWSYRSGGVTIAGASGSWVQFALTYGAIIDEGRLKSLFDPKFNFQLSGVYFDSVDKTKIIGTLEPYFKLQ